MIKQSHLYSYGETLHSVKVRNLSWGILKDKICNVTKIPTQHICINTIYWGAEAYFLSVSQLFPYIGWWLCLSSFPLFKKKNLRMTISMTFTEDEYTHRPLWCLKIWALLSLYLDSPLLTGHKHIWHILIKHKSSFSVWKKKKK